MANSDNPKTPAEIQIQCPNFNSSWCFSSRTNSKTTNLAVWRASEALDPTIPVSVQVWCRLPKCSSRAKIRPADSTQTKTTVACTAWIPEASVARLTKPVRHPCWIKAWISVLTAASRNPLKTPVATWTCPKLPTVPILVKTCSNIWERGEVPVETTGCRMSHSHRCSPEGASKGEIMGQGIWVECLGQCKWEVMGSGWIIRQWIIIWSITTCRVVDLEALIQAHLITLCLILYRDQEATLGWVIRQTRQECHGVLDRTMEAEQEVAKEAVWIMLMTFKTCPWLVWHLSPSTTNWKLNNRHTLLTTRIS